MLRFYANGSVPKVHVSAFTKSADRINKSNQCHMTCEASAVSVSKESRRAGEPESRRAGEPASFKNNEMQEINVRQKLLPMLFTFIPDVGVIVKGSRVQIVLRFFCGSSLEF